jgi:hypothetical protein
MRYVVATIACLTLLALPASARADYAALDLAYGSQGGAQRVVYGQSRGGRDLVAYRVGNGGPAVLYIAGQDGADSLAVDVQQELFDHVAANPVPGAELWFVPVADPDGYDGVPWDVEFDRNWSHRWGNDDEGSSATTRGASAGSEPEVAALGELIDDIEPTHLLEWRVGADGRIVYPESWQVQTAATDAPALAALAGVDDDHPAIVGYSPGPAGELEIANGTLIDTAYHRHGTQAFAVQLPSGAVANAEYLKSRDFALDLARSADDPSRPDSHLGNEAPDFVPHTFPLSHGRPQAVEVLARRALGAVRVHWRVAGGPERSAPTSEHAGDRYGARGAVYNRLRGSVSGFAAGDTVQVWFEGGGERSATFTFTAALTGPGDVLVLAAEDYSGTHPGPAHPGPEYLSAYTDALRGLGIDHDVYDIDARGRRAPDALGVLSHYQAVVWYTGDDIFVREPLQPAGTGTSRPFGETIRNARDYLNDGGRLLVSGQQALAGAWAQLVWDPFSDDDCGGNNLPDMTVAHCVPASDDFLQYWLGAWRNGPADAAARLRAGDVVFELENQFAPTRYLGAPGATRYAGFDRAPDFEVPTGTRYAHVESRDEGYQRLTRTIDLTGATSGRLQFKLAYDADPGYDYVFVEAREAGQSDWTTLPDANGHTSTDPGYSCIDGWVADIHPQLARYVTPGDPCGATGTSGAWNGATGDSAGFQDWDVDLSAWAGKQVEVSIVYAQDWSASGLGVYLDDAVTLRDGVAVETQGFEAGLGAWTADGWTARERTGIVEGLGIATERSLLWGFGLEGVKGAATRQALLAGALDHLGVEPTEDPVSDPPQPPPPPPAPPTPPAPPAPPAQPVPVAPELVVGQRLRVDSRGRAKVRVRCAGRCAGVVKLTRGGRTYARATYKRSGVVRLKLTKAGRRASVLRLKLYRGSGRKARLTDTTTVRLRRA